MGNTRIFDTDCFFGHFFILILYLYFINPINSGHLKLSSNILVMDQLNVTLIGAVVAQKPVCGKLP